MSILNIKDPEAYQLASVLSETTGKSLTRVVIDALRSESQRILPRKVNADEVHRVLAEIDAMAVLDPRPMQAIMADLYDENGLPK